MPTNTTDATRRDNDQTLYYQKDVDLATLDGFQLPSDKTEEFLERMQKEVTLLDMVDTVTLERLEQEVPKFGVPIMSGNQRSEESSRTTNSAAHSGYVKFNATDKSYYILVEPTRDSLKNTHYTEDQFREYILDQFVQRWANDVAIIGIRANADTGDLQSTYSQVGTSTLDDTWNGWIALAEGEDSASERIGLEETPGSERSSMPVYDQASAAPDTQMFNDAIQTLDSRYRDPDDVVFFMSADKVQEYRYHLTEREDPLGATIIFGDSDITPFSYDVVGVNEWPDSYGMFVDPNNLAFGLYETMEIDQTTDTDTVHEDRLHSRNWLEGQFDYQIKSMQAGVLITNIG